MSAGRRAMSLTAILAASCASPMMPVPHDAAASDLGAQYESGMDAGAGLADHAPEIADRPAFACDDRIVRPDACDLSGRWTLHRGPSSAVIEIVESSGAIELTFQGRFDGEGSHHGSSVHFVEGHFGGTLGGWDGNVMDDCRTIWGIYSIAQTPSDFTMVRLCGSARDM